MTVEVPQIQLLDDGMVGLGVWFGSGYMVCVSFWVLLVGFSIFSTHLETGHFSSALVSFSPFRCLGVACGVQRIWNACAAWFNSGYMFFGRFWANYAYFLQCGELESGGVCSPFLQNGEACTVDASGCSLSHFDAEHYFNNNKAFDSDKVDFSC